MLRVVVLVLMAALLVAALAGTLVDWPTLPFAVAALVILLGLLVERYVYKPLRSETPGAGWYRTQERFADPASGRDVVVYYNRRTGERRYVANIGG